jgi:molybdenum cofactor cytidylyltransferase
MTRPALAGVVLAAGRARRFGAPKVELSLGGESLRRRACRLLRAAGLAPVVAVVDRPEAAGDLPSGVAWVVSPGGGSGQGESLARAVAWLSRQVGAAGVEGLVVALADQPLAGEAVQAVVRLWHGSGAPAAALSQGGVVRPPVVLGRRLWPELEGLSGDEGARPLLARLGRRLRVAELAGDWALDVDRPPDWTAVRERWARREGARG